MMLMEVRRKGCTGTGMKTEGPGGGGGGREGAVIQDLLT